MRGLKFTIIGCTFIFTGYFIPDLISSIVVMMCGLVWIYLGISED